MKIKNIKEYRQFYKNEVRDQPTRDENFIGNFRMEDGKKKFGWFDIYHGDKEGYGKAENGIENFLQSFLDMARDGQAVYEFLQNAVDAGSSHYTMVWGKDEVDGNHYLMVANNGDMFSLNSVRSILNVGSSTKTADSKTIGKFGIGFKLAHRLVGKDNGLEELLHENSGPILFSWQNYDLAKLAAGTMPEPMPMQISPIGENQYRADDPAPWLFKILITCFPNLPENKFVSDLPTMANGIISPEPPFSSTEYQTLSRWVNKHSGTLNADTYRSGALFFIKLGEGKENELAEGNLHHGVKFALAILNQTAEEDKRSKNVLRTVQLNHGEPITLPKLEYIKIDIDKKEQADTYAFIRFGVESYAELSQEQLNKVEQESDIEVLFGFRPYDKIDKYFLGAPNFYLYFPLSEEVHNFNYILHSNAFYKGSSRTFLHKGSGKDDGINERLLKVIVDKIEMEFIKLTRSAIAAERRKFLDFYAALLSSSHSKNNERKWIEEPYVNRITTLLRKYIPCRLDQHSADFILLDDPTKVFIKDTAVDIDIQSWGLTGVNWFYWGEGSELQLKQQAFFKLDIKKYGIQQLLKSPETIVNHLNEWIGSDAQKMAIIMKEVLIDHSLLNPEERANLFNLNLLLFQYDEVHSIESFRENKATGYLVTRNKLTEIRDILSKLNLRHSINNVEDFIRTFSAYLGSQSQLVSYEVLTRCFSDTVKDELLSTLSDEEKVRVYNAFRTFNDSPGTRLPLLKIFANKNGDYQVIGNLLEHTTKSWLSPYQVEKDFGNITKTFLIKEEKDFYQAIIKPFWSDIANRIAPDSKKASMVLAEIILLYNQSEWTEKNKNLINGDDGVFFKGDFVKAENVFFSSELVKVPAKSYTQIQDVLLRLFGVVMPDQYFLEYLQGHPFDYDSISYTFDLESGAVTAEDLNALLLLDEYIDGDFFNTHAVSIEAGHFMIFKDQTQIYTTNKKLLNYIDNYYLGKYKLLPEELIRFKERSTLTHLPLLYQIIDLFEEGDMEKELELIELGFEEGLADQLRIFEKLTYLELDASWQKQAQNATYLKLASNLLDNLNNELELAEIHSKLRIVRQHGDIIIGDVHNAEDNILIPYAGRQLHISQSQLLDLEDKEGISIIGEFASLAVKRGLLTSSIAEELFKQNSTGVSNELVERFNQKITDGHIKNAHQLAFLLFSGNFEKSDFENYQIEMASGDLYAVDGNIVLYAPGNESFIDDSFQLNESFSELQSILGMNDLDVICYGEDEDDVLLPKFLFLRGIQSAILVQNADQIAMLGYLYEGWSQLGSQFRTSLADQDWAKVLGFNPSEKLFGALSLENERLPQQVITWVAGENAKMLMLSAIGVSLESAPLVKLRQWLCGEGNDETFSKDLTSYHVNLLYNTVLGLANDFGKTIGRPILFERDSAQLAIIEELYNACTNHPEYGAIADLLHVTQTTYRIGQDEEKGPVKIDQVMLDLLFSDNQNSLNDLFAKELVVSESMTARFTYDDLELQEVFIFPDTAIEHDEPFYVSWKFLKFKIVICKSGCHGFGDNQFLGE